MGQGINESLEGVCKTLVAARGSGILCTFLSSPEERDLVSVMSWLPVAVSDSLVYQFFFDNRSQQSRSLQPRNNGTRTHRLDRLLPTPWILKGTQFFS